ncbi:armadillo-type protein [Scheffersomyces xylosifermentans]|uniref:armadillo-type protein n=1 Tax=Scheffersomyces xylosifermentans TaxID=1304137 RepID=UPI00315D25FD
MTTNLQSRSASMSTPVEDSPAPTSLPSFGTKTGLRSASIGSSFFHKDSPNFFTAAETSSNSFEEEESSTPKNNIVDAVDTANTAASDLDIVGALGNLDLDDDFPPDTSVTEPKSQGPSASTTPFQYANAASANYQFYHPHYPPQPHHGSLTPNPSLGGFAPNAFGGSVNTPSSTWNNTFIPSSAPPFTYNNGGNTKQAGDSNQISGDLPLFVKPFELPNEDKNGDKNGDESKNIASMPLFNTPPPLHTFGGILDSQVQFGVPQKVVGIQATEEGNSSENELDSKGNNGSSTSNSTTKNAANTPNANPANAFSPAGFSSVMDYQSMPTDVSAFPPNIDMSNLSSINNLSSLNNMNMHNMPMPMMGGPNMNMWNQHPLMTPQMHPGNMRNNYIDSRGQNLPPQGGIHPGHMMGQFNGNGGQQRGNHHGRHRNNYNNNSNNNSNSNSNSGNNGGYDGMNVHRKMHNNGNHSNNNSNSAHRRKGDDAAKYANAKLDDFSGEIYSLCKDQHGCRFLQRQLDLGRDVSEGKAVSSDSGVVSSEIAATMIFNEIYLKIIELMTDPFGNYLIQKLFENVSVDQRIILVKNASPEFIRIALDPHGTRALQKLVECISTEEESQLIIGSLSPHIVSLSRDLNGNHVVQKCLQKLKPSENQFIFEAASLHCNEIATHRHGCCVLQRCLDHGNAEQRKQLSLKVAENATNLSLDPFGNYVVQYVLSRGDDVSIQIIMNHIKANIVSLSLHKFGSNVIEKSLRINKLTDSLFEVLLQHTDRFAEMLNDAFGNYVLQTSLDVASPQDLAKLSGALQPLLGSIKNTPHGRRIMTKIQQL